MSNARIIIICHITTAAAAALDVDDDIFIDGIGGSKLSFDMGGPTTTSLDSIAEELGDETNRINGNNKEEEDGSLLQQQSPKKQPPPNEQQYPKQQQKLNQNAKWLYDKCKIAKSNMEYPHSAIHLATTILHAIREHYSTSNSKNDIIKNNNNGNNNNNNEEEDEETEVEEEQIQIIQNLLFKLIDDEGMNGKKRDLQFVFDVSLRSYELFEDLSGAVVDDGSNGDDDGGGGLTVEALRRVAIACGDDDGEGASTSLASTKSPSATTPKKGGNERTDNDDNVPSSSTTSTPSSLMKKNIRSRRKKRQSNSHIGMSNNNTTEENGKEIIIGNNQSKSSSDFPILHDNGDDLNMQEDDNDTGWSFLSSPQNRATESNNNDDEEEEEEGEGESHSPVRVTRSMKQSTDSVAGEEEEDDINDDAEMRKEDDGVSVQNDEAALPMENEESVGNNDDDDDNENDEFIQTGTLSFDQPNDDAIHNEERQDSNTNEQALSRNEMSPLKQADNTDENEDVCDDEESKFSQGESDLIDEVKLSSRKRNERREVVRIMFTGVTPTRRHMQMIETIGAEIVESIDQAHTVTHVIVTDGRAKLRRTPKLMICICKTANILSTEWLEQSANEQRVLDATPFLWIGDKEAETKYNFSMKETVQNGMLARTRGGVLGGYYVYVCSGIAGNRAPSIKEFKLIIEAAGGHLLNSLAPSEVMDPLKTIVLTNDPATSSQLKERGVKNIVKCGGKVETTSWLFHSIITQTNSLYEEDDTVGSVSTPGSKVSHLEVALPLQKEKEPQGASLPTTTDCSSFMSRESLISSNEAKLWMETLGISDDEAFGLTDGLWQSYFNDGSKTSKATSRKTPSKPTRRLRGRTHSVSPMVGTTVASTNEKNLSAAKKESILHENSYITWEAVVLFTLQIRSRDLQEQESLVSEDVVSAASLFASPIAIQAKGKALALLVNANSTDSADVEIFGTLQDVFSLHQNQSSGMIPEHIVASFALMAAEAVSAMHSCGVVHNNLGMDSFLVAKRVDASPARKKKSSRQQRDEWFLQLIGFGDKSIVLSCHEHACEQTHYEHDYNCLGNIVHQLLTGGIGITFAMSNDGSVEVASKQFIKGNLFLRGALSWCALINALLGIGDVQKSSTSDQFRLDYPVNLLQLANEEESPDKRLYQFGWSARMLQELLSSTQKDSLSDFMGDLCTFNSRFVLPNVSLDTFARCQSSGNQTFELATEIKNAEDNEKRHREFSLKEAKLEADSLALAERESNCRARAAQLKVDLQNSERLRQSILKKEREVQVREDQIIQKYAEEEERLKRMKDDLLLREQRLEEKIRQSEQYSHKHEETISYSKSPSHNSVGYKRKNESNLLHQTPPPMNAYFQSLGSNGEMSSSQKKRRRSRSSSYLEQMTPNNMENSNEEYPEQELNEGIGQNQQQHESSQESMMSSSSQKRKRNRGKSPLPLQLDSLQSLPKSPKKQPPPKKVFIGFEE